MIVRTRVLTTAAALLLTAAVAACAGKAAPRTSLGNAAGGPAAAPSPHTGGAGSTGGPSGGGTSGPTGGTPGAGGTVGGSGGPPSAPSGGAGGSGSTSGSGNHRPPIVPTGVVTLPVAPSPQDCSYYSPNTLSVQDQGSLGYRITDGTSALFIVDNLTDAALGLQLASSYSRLCFIGRGNSYTGDDRYHHIVEYWTSIGKTGASPPTADCFAYDNTHLTIQPAGSQGYQLFSAGNNLALLATPADAQAAENLAATHHKECWIGRDNTRPDYHEYVITYWL